MEVGLGCTSQEICDGQGLASPGRNVDTPESSLWKSASEPIMCFTRKHGMTALLTLLAMGHVTESPFEEEAVARLKEQVVRALAEQGLHRNRKPEDRKRTPCGLQVSPALCCGGSGGQPHKLRPGSSRRTGGVAAPTPALYPAKKKWSLQYDGTDSKGQLGGRTTRLSNRGSRESWKSWKMRTSSEAHRDRSERKVPRFCRGFTASDQERQARVSRHRLGLV